AIVRPAQKPEFGHYQANGIMSASKSLGMNPRELADKVVQNLDTQAAEKIEVAGPGFINIHLAPAYLANEVMQARTDDRLGIDKHTAETIVVDYSSPNLAKEMHIGHLRSTTIGDAVARILEFLGHNVIRANHVGDWGAQFGSLLAYMDQLRAEGQNELKSELKDLETFYRDASALFKSDEAFASKAREYVVRLQSGDEQCLTLWEQFIEESVRHCEAVYKRLNITLTRKDLAPESSYNESLPVVIEELGEQGLLVESEGAQCVFIDEFKGKDGKPLPAIIRKSDGGYPYMATDLAAVRYRSLELGARRALYFIGAEQQLHLRQLFAVARAAGYISDDQEYRHLSFGLILKKDGKRYKTRDGADVKLADVLEEAVSRAHDLVTDKNAELTDDDRTRVSEVVGIGAVKYAELSKNRTTDYTFDWDTMLSFEGNTAPYLLYAYTRIQSIFKRASIAPEELSGELALQEPAEIQLAVKLLQFTEALEAVLEDYQPNLLCNYLFELSGLFMSFYEKCPVLKAEEHVRNSRLILCDATARTVKQALDLLGIRTVDQM
ncbi:MAG: arginine--tRNA ligase, partial [Pseudomonadales bacterium]|nr:arginine--tRNA ligase [Pseudomonadales bacterium]